MKRLFASSAVALILASIGLWRSQPDLSTERPVIHWITDNNPTRVEQVAAFHRWLVANGHTAADGGPVCELRLDASNNTMTKKVIQSVSGVGADVMDIFSGRNMRLMASMGAISTVDEPAQRLGFSLADTYELLEVELAIDGRQYMYPCNVAANTVVVNPAAFDRLGLPQPPTRWSIETFEAVGKAFIEAANPPGTLPGDRTFFIDSLPPEVVHRSFGISGINETGTASDFDSQGYRDALEIVKKWTYTDQLMPRPDDVRSFVANENYVGTILSLFGSGKFAMVHGGRQFLIRLRTMPGMSHLTVAEFPHGGFPNAQVSARAAAVYAGGEHQHLVHLFMAYLASDVYNDQIVRSSDAMPPNPAALTTEAYLRPPNHPDEWNFHGPLAEMILEIGIAGSYSPFIQASELVREQLRIQDLYFLSRLTVDEAAKRTHQAVNQGIAATLERKPEVRAEHERRVMIQAEIDRRKRDGRPIPSNWIFNAFHSRYFERMGLLAPPEPFPAAANDTALSIAGTPR